MPPGSSDLESAVKRAGSDDYFLDLPDYDTAASIEDPSSSHSAAPEAHEPRNGMDGAAKTKRIACILCRKRKLKCDGMKPSCGTCSRLGHKCAYDEVRRKSGPKRGYVKALEARLAQVETMLKTDVNKDGTSPPQLSTPSGAFEQTATSSVMNNNFLILSGEQGTLNLDSGHENLQSTFTAGDLSQPGLSSVDEPFSWDMVALGLEEPLPPQSIINELTHAYFDKVHFSLPMIHRARFLAAMDLASHMRPPICLRYAMWALAAGTIEKYEPMEEQFYHRSRKYIQLDELRGHGESIITLAHTQTWILLCMYEVKHMYFPRSWLSTGRAVRLCQMLGLHRLDGLGLDVKQCLPPPKDWTEREERRRTFWAAYSEDRCASIGTGWPMTIEEQDILTNLPASEDAFQNNRPMRTMSLHEATESNSAEFSSFAGVALMSTLFGRNLTHLHRPGPDDNDEDLNGAFWKRHRSMDSILLNKALALPDYLRLPGGISDPNVIFLNMCIHTSAICLHQAAIFKADKNQMPPSIATESKVRCITAAAEVASIMRSVCHLDLAMMNPFMAFCLYVAARVFIQYLKSRPNDQQILSSLQFLLSAMHALKRKNPLTESFLVQLEVDIEGTGITVPKSAPTGKQTLPFATRVPFANARDACSPLLNIREEKATFNGTDGPQINGGPTMPVAENRISEYTNGTFQVVDRSASASNRLYAYGRDKPLNGELQKDAPHNLPPTDVWPPGIPDVSLGIPTSQVDTGQLDALHQSIDATEMDLSPDESGGHPTPSSTSNRGPSSRTSFTPPDATPHDPTVTHNNYPQSSKTTPNLGFSNLSKPSATPNPSNISFFTSSDFSVDDFSNLDPRFFAKPNIGQDQTFALSQGWELDSTGLTPVATAVPITDSNLQNPDAWNRMMQGISGWENNVSPEPQGNSWNGNR